MQKQCLGCLERHRCAGPFCGRCEGTLQVIDLAKTAGLIKLGVAAALALTLWWPL